jgi:CBS domain-containing protein
MGAPVVTVAPRTAVERAVTLLSAHGFTALPVVDDDHLIGIVTRGDLVRAVSRQTVGDAARRLGEHGAEAHRG